MSSRSGKTKLPVPKTTKRAIQEVIDLEENADNNNKEESTKKGESKSVTKILIDRERKKADSTSTPTGRTATSCKPNQLQKLQAVSKLDFSPSPTNTIIKTKAALRKLRGGWVDRNFPVSVNELFVHKKKVEEVEYWLKATMANVDCPKTFRNVGKICVLTGPTGSGKTSTLFLVAKELDLEIKEWINPMSLTEYNPDRFSKFDPDEVQGRSQFDLFSDFLFRASRYGTIPIKGRAQSKHKLVVVEDFPQMFYKKPDMFHNSILRPYASLGLFPVVFIIPDSSSRDTNAFSLFPKPIMQELNIASISFNPVAPTFMLKFMSTVCSREGISVEKSTLESIAAASGGDIRCAINTLEFKLSEGLTPVFKAPVAKKTKTTKQTRLFDSNKDVQKDETLFLFRALGKVLYSKRNMKESVEDQANLVPHDSRKYLRNNPLEEDVEHMVDKIEVAADTFLNFLQQNYLPFFGSMDDIVLASAHLADSEFLLSRWPFDDSGTISRALKEREVREEIALLVASRGLMYSNVHKTKNEWRPLKKPMLTDARTRIQTRLEAARSLFPSEGPIQINFFSEYLPYYNRLIRSHPSKWLPNQKSFISELGAISKNKYNQQRFHNNSLMEKDAAEEPGEDSPNSPSTDDIIVKELCKAIGGLPDQKVDHLCDTSDEEDYVIEDYSDED